MLRGTIERGDNKKNGKGSYHHWLFDVECAAKNSEYWLIFPLISICTKDPHI